MGTNLKKNFWLLFLTLFAVSFTHASEAIDTVENLNESTVDTEISPWLGLNGNEAKQSFLTPEVFSFTGNICNVELSFRIALIALIGKNCTGISAFILAEQADSDDTVNLVNDGINTLNGTVLSAFTNVVRFLLSGNNISELPAGTFKDLALLEHILVGGNNISTVEVGAFDNLPELTLIDLAANEITGSLVGVFDNLPKLDSLDLSANNLIDIPANLFSNLPLLKTVFLRDSNISSVDAGLFNNAPSLRTLDLRDNNLATLPINMMATHGDPGNFVQLRTENNPFSIPGNPAYNPDGWEITDVQWQVVNLATHQYRLRLGHELASELNVTYTVVNGSVGGEHDSQCYDSV